MFYFFRNLMYNLSWIHVFEGLQICLVFAQNSSIPEVVVKASFIIFPTHIRANPAFWTMIGWYVKTCGFKIG